MKKSIPVRLGEEPLLEVIWEVRFVGADQPVADLLPGVLFSDLQDRYPNIVRLRARELPVLEHDPNLRYLPKTRFENDNRAVQIGDRSVSLHCRRPYSGWSRFSADIRHLAAALQKSGLTGRLQRFALKYVDLIELGHPPDVGCLNLDLMLGEWEISTSPIQLRAEIPESDLLHIVEIISPAEATLPGNDTPLKGVLLVIDTIKMLGESESWDCVEGRLDDVHSACKNMFFDLLKPETVDALNPEYEE